MSEGQRGLYTIASPIVHLFHAQIRCLQTLSSFHLGKCSQEFWLASFQGKLIIGRLEDKSQPLYCSWSQGPTDTHHFPSLLPTTHPQNSCSQSSLSCEATQTLIPEGNESLGTMPFCVCDCYMWPSKLGRRVSKDALLGTWSEGNITSLQARICRPKEPRAMKIGDIISPSRSLGVMIMRPLLLPPLCSMHFNYW